MGVYIVNTTLSVIESHIRRLASIQQAIVLITLLIPVVTKLTLGNYLIVFSHTHNFTGLLDQGVISS